MSIEFTLEDLLQCLSDERAKTMRALVISIRAGLPKGYEERIQHNMVSFVVPHSLFPDGYHCNPLEPVPFISVVSNKQNITIHHFGLYQNDRLTNWFIDEFRKIACKNPDMGKACIRFKNGKDIPYDLIQRLASLLDVPDFLALYQAMFKPKKQPKKSK